MVYLGSEYVCLSSNTSDSLVFRCLFLQHSNMRIHSSVENVCVFREVDLTLPVIAFTETKPDHSWITFTVTGVLVPRTYFLLLLMLFDTKQLLLCATQGRLLYLSFTSVKFMLHCNNHEFFSSNVSHAFSPGVLKSLARLKKKKSLLLSCNKIVSGKIIFCFKYLAYFPAECQTGIRFILCWR